MAALWIIVIALGAAVACTDLPTAPSATPGRGDALKNMLVTVPQPLPGCEPTHRRPVRLPGRWQC